MRRRKDNHRRQYNGLRTYIGGIPAHHEGASDLRRAAMHILTSNDPSTQVTGIALGALAVVGAVTLTALQIVGGRTKA